MKRFYVLSLLLLVGSAGLTVYGKQAVAPTAETQHIKQLSERIEYYHQHSRPTDQEYITTLRELFKNKLVTEICPKEEREGYKCSLNKNVRYALNELAFVWNDLLYWKDMTPQEYDNICRTYMACPSKISSCLVIDPNKFTSYFSDDEDEYDVSSFRSYSRDDYSAYIDFLYAHVRLCNRVGDIRYSDDDIFDLIAGLQWKASTYMYEYDGKTDPYHWLDTSHAYSIKMMKAYPISDSVDVTRKHLLIAMCRMSAEGYTPDVKAYLQQIYERSYLYMEADVLTLQAEGELLNGNAGQAVMLQQQAYDLDGGGYVDDDGLQYYSPDYFELLMIAVAAKDKKTVRQLEHERMGYAGLYWKAIGDYDKSPYRYKLERLFLKNASKIYGGEIKGRTYSEHLQKSKCEDIWKYDSYEDEEYEDDWDDEADEADYDVPPQKVPIGELSYYLYDDQYTASVAGWAQEDDSDDNEEDAPVTSVKPTKVVIPGSVTYKGNKYKVTTISQAFYGCKELVSVSIPATVRYIVPKAFGKCSNLVKFKVAAGNSNYCTDDGVLMSKDRRTLVAFPSGRTQAYVVPNSVKNIIEEAFCGSRLSSLVIPEGVTDIELNALNQSEAMTSVVWNAKQCGVAGSHIGVLPPSVTTLQIGTNVETIPDKLCYNLDKLTSVVIPENVAYIGEEAFSGCHSLSCDVRATYNDWAYDAFVGVPNIIYHGNADELNVDALSVNGYVEDNLVYQDSTKRVLLAGFPGVPDNLIIPEGVERIGSQALLHADIHRVTIPESVTGIDSAAFGPHLRTVIWNARHCADMPDENHLPFTQVTDSFVIGSQVEYIPAMLCFDANISTLVLSEGVKSIGWYAFGFCNYLTQVSVPSSVESIDNAAFGGCHGLQSIDVMDDNTAYCSVDGVVMSKDRRTLVACPAGKSGSYSIPEGVTYIGAGAFDNCGSLERIDIPASVTHIGWYAFNSCVNLTSVIIPEGVERMDGYAFSNCSSLTSIVWNARHCADFSAYDAAPFSDDCDQITSFVFGEKVEHIPAWLCLAMGALEEVHIPSSTVSIGCQSFMGCSGLRSLTIPAKVTLIEGMAFDDCDDLTSVTCYALTPPDMGVLTFDDGERVNGVFFAKGSTNSTIQLFVPATSIAAYKQAEQWKDFGIITPLTAK